MPRDRQKDWKVGRLISRISKSIQKQKPQLTLNVCRGFFITPSLIIVFNKHPKIDCSLGLQLIYSLKPKVICVLVNISKY